MEFQIDKSVEILSKTPKVLRVLLEDLSDEWIEKEFDSDEWSPFDVVGHLIHGEKTDWIPRAEIILRQEGNAEFEPFDRFAQFENSKGKTLAQLLDEFEDLRNKNLAKLENFNLSDKQLQLKGLHPELGEVNLSQLISTWTVHDLTHIRQITIQLAKKYSENVGVWKNYLSILQ